MPVTVLVEWGERRKKMVVEDVSQLLMTCREKFEIKDETKIRLEIMETEFSSGIWIEFEATEDLSNGSRLRIVADNGNRLVNNCEIYMYIFIYNAKVVQLKICAIKN